MNEQLIRQLFQQCFDEEPNEVLPYQALKATKMLYATLNITINQASYQMNKYLDNLVKKDISQAYVNSIP